ncbi:hypothetical protein ACFYMW_10140 [Streptomyces sp. NPDC006692]|uniref:hypothetical protein n=1 Tax=unclassified Streptomyces TaxID=2593676 RepID=UPI0036935229
MHNSPAPAPGRKTARPLRRLLSWTARHRRTATGHVLRGICYGTGTALVSLASLWIQHRM